VWALLVVAALLLGRVALLLTVRLLRVLGSTALVVALVRHCDDARLWIEECDCVVRVEAVRSVVLMLWG